MMTLAMSLTRAWVQLYTKGLPAELRDARRAEIESDLWEQGYESESNGEDPQETGSQVLWRLLAGVPADLAWRWERRGSGSGAGRGRTIVARGGSFMYTTLEKVMMGITLILGLFMIIALPPNVLDDGGSTLDVAVVVVLGAMLVAGVLLSGRAPWLGVALVAVASLVTAAITHWMIVISLPIAIVLIAFAVLRARKVTRERGPDRLTAA